MRNPIDALGGLLLRHGPERLRVFPDGWGMLPEVDLADPGPIPTIDLEPHPPGAVADTDRFTVRDLTFPSPAAELLPMPVRRAFVREVAPRSFSGTVVLLAAWNDEGYDSRMRLARRLAARGRRVWILEQPFYGARRAVEEGMPIRTVADFLRMGWAAVQEARGLVSAARTDGPVVVAGYSMGGSLTTAVAATSPGPLSVAVLAGAPSPAPVYLEGALSKAIAWDALGGRARAADLWEALDRASVLPLPPPGHPTVVVASRSDGYVPEATVEALVRHWDIEDVRWLRGGHAGLWWWRPHDLARAIDDALARFPA